MGSDLLTSSASMRCPHGAEITATPTEQNGKVAGDRPLKMTDSFTVSGCQFKIPAGPAQIPSPCTAVIWVVPAVMSRFSQTPELTKQSVGLCIGTIGVQGSVQISSAGQSVVKGT